MRARPAGVGPKRPKRVAERPDPDASVYPSFGSMGYWHLVEGIDLVIGPDDSLQARAHKLLNLYWNHKYQAQKRWPIQPIQVRALALELTYAFSSAGLQLPDDLVILLGELLQVRDFVQDPTTLLAGDDGRGHHDRQAMNIALHLDTEYARTHGRGMPVNTLCNAVKKLTGLQPSWATVRAWKARKDYQDSLHAATLMHDNSPSQK